MLLNKTTLFSLATCLVSIYAESAPEYHNNPRVVAQAGFPSYGKNKKFQGFVKFFSTDGKVKVHVDVTKLPKRRGPFYYHIHDKPIPESGDCEAAGTHFNPYKASPDCAAFPTDDLCQVGDLSGKHGWIDTTCFEQSYIDPYLSLDAKDPGYFVGKSVVFHYKKKLKKFACANI
ncbi:Cu,Zn superoxide dismutase-like protein, partial [Ascoidea rubescens DSM 1968]